MFSKLELIHARFSPALACASVLVSSALPASADTLLDAAAHMFFLDQPVTIQGDKAVYKDEIAHETHTLTVKRCVITDRLQGSNPDNLGNVLPYDYNLTYSVMLLKLAEPEPRPAADMIRIHVERAWPSAEQAFCIDGYTTTLSYRGTRIQDQTKECRPTGWYQVHASGTLQETADKAKAAFQAFRSACMNAKP